MRSKEVGKLNYYLTLLLIDMIDLKEVRKDYQVKALEFDEKMLFDFTR